MPFVDLDKPFDRVLRRVMQWVLWKKGLPEIWVKTEMSLYEGSKTRIKIGSEFSKEFYVAVGVHQESVLSPLLFAIVVIVVTENAREGLTNLKTRKRKRLLVVKEEMRVALSNVRPDIERICAKNQAQISH